MLVASFEGSLFKTTIGPERVDGTLMVREKQSSYQVTSAPGSGCTPRPGDGPTDLCQDTKSVGGRVRPVPGQGTLISMSVGGGGGVHQEVVVVSVLWSFVPAGS